jgi:quinol monooxygenase YgiN
MYGAFTQVVAKPAKRGELLEFLQWDATVAQFIESGTLRFDVWPMEGDDRTIYLYEAYRDRASFEEHQRNEPFKRYISQIRPNLVDQELSVIDWSESLVSNEDVISHS